MTDPTFCEEDGTIQSFNCQREEQCDDCFMVDHRKECDWCDHYDHPESDKQKMETKTL